MKKMSEKFEERYYKIENLETRDSDCHRLELSHSPRPQITLQNRRSNKMSQSHSFSNVSTKEYKIFNIRETFIIEFAKCNDFSTGDAIKLPLR